MFIQRNSTHLLFNKEGITDLTKLSDSILGKTQVINPTILIKFSILDNILSNKSMSIDFNSIDLTSDSQKETYSSDESDVTNVICNKYYCNKKGKRQKEKLKNKIVDKIEYNNYIGGITSEFTKDSPFINMLINRRNRYCDHSPMCHIATFVPDLGIENKFTNWAFGKFAIGENSERVRYGNKRLSTHAEMDALHKLDNLIRVRRCKKQKMDLVVIRVNRSGNLCESAPCYHCTKELSNSTVVTIKKIYFSRSDGTITCVKFLEWLKNESFHISKGWKWMSHNCNSK